MATTHLLVKAVLGDAIVMLRPERDVSLAELRQRVHDKFASSEGVTLRGAFALEYVPTTTTTGGGGGGAMTGGKRVSTVSALSTSSGGSVGSADWARAVPLRCEGDWANAVARCGSSKVTLRVSYHGYHAAPQ
jgi:hypothetical protein